MIYVGSARIGENSKITGGAKGDQKQKASKNDTVGEVSSQPFYVHQKGWNIVRPKSVSVANKIASENKKACDNKNIGYNQNERYDADVEAKKVKSLGDIKKPVNADCSSLTRAEIITATGKDPGDFTTYNLVDALTSKDSKVAGLFEYKGAFISQAQTPVYDGDILVTRTKGHVVTVNSGNPRKEVEKKTETATSAVYYETTTNVHIRMDAGVKNQSMGVIPAGKKVKKLSGTKEVDGTKWLHVSVTLSSVKVVGYVSGKYLKKL